MENNTADNFLLNAGDSVEDSQFLWVKKIVIAVIVVAAIIAGIVLAGGYLISKIERVDLKLVKASNLVLSADNYVNSITDTDSALSNVISNGHNIYYNADDSANAWLDGKTVKLNGGGQLMPRDNWVFYANVIYSMIMT